MSVTILQASIMVGLTVFTFQTKYDFTIFYGSLITCLWAMIGISVVSIFVPFSSSMELLQSGAGACLFSLFIVVDTQMMLTKLSTDEYILCAINLYLDIINLFLYILKMMSKRD
jgi:FtsH-binding integral membrane protein